MATDASLRHLVPLAWPLFAVMWLVFPIASVVDMLGTGLTPARMLAFLASMVAYASVYLWLVLRYPFRGELSPLERRVHVALLVTLAALALYLEVAFGSGIPYQFMFVVIAAAVTLPTLPAASAVVAIMALTSGIYALRSGWDALSSTWESAVAPFAIVGFSMIIVNRLVLTVRELRAAREEITRLAVAEERLRFARDLHDLLGHSLSSITLKSELAGRLLPVAPDKAAAEVRDIEGVARNALREVREAVAGYRQPTLDEELASAQQILEAAGIACQIERSVGVLPNDVDAVLAWTVREGTTNVIRHSQAKHCDIRLVQEGEEIHAEISDDGVGFSSPSDETNVNGSGLSGLAERVAASSGKFEAKTPSGGGFSLRVSLPL
jgi:two-component system sensor histidine kinase DesK